MSATRRRIAANPLQLVLGRGSTLMDPWLWLLLFIYAIPLVSESTQDITRTEVFHAGILGIAIYLWLLKRFAAKRSPLPRHHLTWPVLFSLLIATFSIMPALANNVSSVEWARWWWRYLPFTTFFLIATELRSRARLHQIITAFLVVSAVTSLQAILYFVQIGGDIILFRHSLTQFNDILILPAFLLSFSLFVHDRGDLRSQVLSLILIGILSTRIFIQVGRLLFFESLTAVLIILGIRIWGRSRRLRTLAKWLITGAILITTILLATTDYVSDALNFWQTKLQPAILWRGVEIRLEEWRSVLNASIESPVWGYGLGSEFFRTGEVLSQRGKVGSVTYVHSYFFFLLLHFGLLGILVFYVMAYRALRAGLRLLRQQTSPFLRSISVAIFVSLVIIYLTSFIAVGPTRDIHMTMAVFLGIIAALERSNFFRSNAANGGYKTCNGC